MKRILIKLIELYQKIPGNFHNYCRFSPTCSNYAIESIKTFGIIRGTLKSLIRILKCNPFGNYGFDPVIKEDKNEKNY